MGPLPQDGEFDSTKIEHQVQQRGGTEAEAQGEPQGSEQSETPNQPRAGEQSLPPQGVIGRLLWRSDGEDDASLIGFRVVNPVEQAWGSERKEQPVKERLISLTDILRRLPVFLLSQFFRSIIPVCMAFIPIIVNGFAGRALRERVPSHEGSWKELELLAPTDPELGYGVCILSMVPMFLFLVVIAPTFYVMVRAQWRRDVASWGMRCFAPMTVGMIAYVFVKPLVMTKVTPGTVDRIGLLGLAGTQVAVCVLFLWKTGAANKNAHFGKICLSTNIAVILMFVIYRMQMARIVNFSDAGKIIVVGVLNPILSQLAVVLQGRLVGRGMHHNDPSTSWTIMGVCLSWEKTYARVVIATMDSTLLSLVAALTAVAGTGLARGLLGEEDVRAYRLLGKLAKVENYGSNLKCKRNRMFQMSVLCFDFALELSLIVAFSFLPVTYGLEMHGRAIGIAEALTKMAVQAAQKIVVFAVLVVFCSIHKGEDWIAFGYNKCQHWSWIVGVMTLFPGCMLSTSLFPPLLCSAPETSNSVWGICA